MANAGATAWTGWWGRTGVLVSCTTCCHVQHHGDEHSNDGFRRDGHGVYNLQETVILMVLAS
jgi:hypothetical protein